MPNSGGGIPPGGFCTAVNCMDGRVQEPVIDWLREHFQVKWVDKITEAGPVASLVEGDQAVLESIQRRVKVSIEAHASKGIAIAVHDGCAGMPMNLSIEVEQEMGRAAARKLQALYPDLPVLALWIGLDGSVTVLE